MITEHDIEDEDQLALPMPPEDSPDYNPVVHGTRSDDELVDLLRSRIDSIGKGKWMTMDDLRAKQKEISLRFGRPRQSPVALEQH